MKLRKLSALPSWSMSSTLNTDPNRATPNTAAAEPSCTNDRRLSEEPRFNISKTERL
jgi:hypothetical protein